MVNRDFRDLLAAFGARDVRFLIVGAYAVTFHARPRFTKDLGSGGREGARARTLIGSTACSRSITSAFACSRLGAGRGQGCPQFSTCHRGVVLGRCRRVRGHDTVQAPQSRHTIATALQRAGELEGHFV